MTDPSPHLDETPARQGQTGTGLRWVLRISLALIVIALAVIWAVYAGPLSGHGGQTNTAAVAAATPSTGSAQTTGG
jgi:hypothetical protein